MNGNSAPMTASPLTQAHYFLAEIKETLTKTLAHDTPDLAMLTGLLALFANDFGSGAPVAVAAPPVAPEETPPVQESVETVVEAPPVAVDPSPVTPPAVTEVRQRINNRADALHRLQEVRSWFAMTEPSSPLIQVLKYAEESIGKSFADLLKMYPPEIVAMLNQEKE
jgi:hypothetical protein